MKTLFNKILRIIKIDSSVFTEIDAHKSSVLHGFVVVLLTSLSNALIARKYLFTGNSAFEIPILILVIVWIFLNWYVLSHIINFLGFKAFPEGKSQNKYKSVLKIIGFSYSPELAKFIILIFPNLLQVVSLGTFIWVITCQVLGTKIIFNFKSFWKSLGIVVLSYILQILMVVIFVIIIYNFFG
tara:strand:+ start:566 stop:1117 length:552 start_codon:yes stop_codon:yes gene_type:complete